MARPTSIAVSCSELDFVLHEALYYSHFDVNNPMRLQSLACLHSHPTPPHTPLLRPATLLPTPGLTPPQRASQNPLFRRNPLLLLLLFLLILTAPLHQAPEYHIILRSAKVHQTVPRNFPLPSRRRNNTMDIAPQPAARELDECITEVDDAVSGERFDVAPAVFAESLLCVACAVLGWGDGGHMLRQSDLQTAEAIEEDSYRTEVCVLAQCDTFGSGFLGWCADEADLVTACSSESVDGLEAAVAPCFLAERKTFRDQCDDGGADGMTALDIVLEQSPFLLAIKHLWTGKPLAQPKNIVLRDIVEFIPISRPLCINNTLAIPLVAEVAALALEVVLDFLGDWEIVEGSHELEELFCVFEERFAVIAVEVEVEEAELLACLPASLLLVCICG